MSLYFYFENYETEKYKDFEGNEIDFNTIIQDEIFLRKFNGENMFDLSSKNNNNNFDVKNLFKKYNKIIDVFFELEKVVKK